ncbi:MAG TPA: FAD-dependent oxidoreductase [Pseudomonadales bacterium]|nr:FAD-dependent oxidoreductase [Pseudomonadales bacterium]
MSDPIIIIGTGLSGYTLGKEFRRYDKETPLLFVTSDDGRNYSKPMLSTGFAKKKTADELAVADAGAMAEQLQASIRTFAKVTAIDPANHGISMGDEKLRYSKLVIAWGAECISAPLQGDGLDLVYSVNDLLDYATFQKAVAGKKKVLIIGAGLIGSEYANDLAMGGFEVEAVDPLSGPLGSLMPPKASAAVQHALERECKVTYHFGTVVESIDKKGSGVIATLADGSKVEADVVLSAVGMRPRIGLARQSGIAVNRGITVNRYLEASVPDVYAMGDCAEVEGHVRFYVLPLMACARTLAKTLSGERTAVVYGPMPVGVKVTVCPIQLSPPLHGVAGEWHEEVDGDNVCSLFRSPEGNLLGFALTGKCTEQKTELAKQLPAILA